MFNLGLPEILVISVAALLVFGPKRLPELAKGLGKGIRDFKKALEGDEKKQISEDDSIDVGSSEKNSEPSSDDPNTKQNS